MTKIFTKLIEEIEKWKTARGKAELLKHLNGEVVTQRQAIYAKCYDCMGGYDDIKEDCNLIKCPLHPFMPYNKNKTKTRNLSEEQKKAIGERFKNARKPPSEPEDAPAW